MFPSRLLLAFAIAASATLTLAQGGAGGYGQGGQGGGFGGGGMGGAGGGRGGGYMGEPERSQDDKKVRPDEESTADIWESKTAILTPGDRVEFKLKMRKGETVFAGVTSDAFDPALSIEDSKGTVLLKNDDRAEGDQSPFLIYRVPAEGTYLLKVLSYRSVSGGKFTVKMRTFLASDAPLAPTVHDVPAPEPNAANRVIFRLNAKKDKIYDLRDVLGLKPYPSQHGLLRLVGPTGVEASDFVMVPTGDYTPVFLALADGDYYAEYESSGETRFKSDFREVPVTVAKTTDTQTFSMEPGDLRVVEFPVKPDRIVRTTLTGAALVHAMSAPAGPAGSAGGNDEAYGNNAAWTWFRMNRDSDDDLLRVFHGDGTARMAIRSRSNKPQQVTMKNVESLPVWETGEPYKSSIDIGDSRLFLIKSSKSELMKVFAGASHFQPKLDIFRMNGELANSLKDRKTHTATDDLYFPDEASFLVRLSCDGHGGSGDFTMKRDTLAPVPYALGKPQALKLDGSNFGLFSVNLEAGKRYELMTDEPGKSLRADLLDDDGQFLTSQAIRFDKVVVQYFVPTRSGRHRLWLRGEPGERHFKFEAHVAPTIGG